MLVKQLLDADRSLRVSALLRRLDPDLARMRRCDVVEGGLFDPHALEQTLKNADLVVNLAALNPGGDDADWTAREDFFVLNGLGAGMVAAMAERHRLPLIHFSTVSVYETAAYVKGRSMAENDAMPCLGRETASFFDRTLAWLLDWIEANGPLGENNTPVRRFKTYLADQSYPQSTPIYGLSKLIGERLTLRLTRRACCIRMSDVYGPGHESRGVMVDHLNQMQTQNTLSVDLSPRAGVYFIFIDDVTRMVASLVHRLLSDRLAVPGLVNFCGFRIDNAAMRSHLLQLCRSRGINRAIDVATSAGREFDRRYSSDAFDRHFPEFEKTSFGIGLRSTFDAHLRHLRCLGNL